jgi:hypothetical protein
MKIGVRGQEFVVYWKVIIPYNYNGLLTSISAELKDYSGLNIFSSLAVSDRTCGFIRKEI